MSRVRFYAADGVTLLRQQAAMPGERLLDIARQADAALHWRCGQGTCGTCLVRLRHAAQPASFRPTARERNVLARFGRAASGGETWPDTPGTWRLACHVYLGDADLDVLPGPEG